MSRLEASQGIESRVFNFNLVFPVFTFRSHYWLWCPVIAPIVGALGTSLCSTPVTSGPLMANHTSIIVGTFAYDLLFYTGGESILNNPYVLLLLFVACLV